MAKRARNTSFYLGFGLYWTWVYLSFNSLPITGSLANGAPFIPLLHIVSGLVGCAAFAIAIVAHHRIESSSRLRGAIWTAAAITTVGTLLYTLPLAEGPRMLALAGGIITGFSSPWVALAWGVAYCRLDARHATALTAGSFLLAGILYAAISYLVQPFDGILVAFMPMLSVLALYLCDRERFGRPMRNARASETLNRELAGLFSHTGQGRIFLGILMTMFVCGGLRIYIMQLQSAVYAEPLLIALPIALVSFAFLGYSASISATSLNLGPLYRIAMPLFAIAFAAIAMFGIGNADASFMIVSAGATLIDMLTWVLLFEIARSTRFSPLLVFALGRLAIHAGMAVGEAVALQMAEGMSGFFLVSIIILVVVAGYMFTDRDTTFFFEPPDAGELPDDTDESDLVQGRIDAIAREYGLSPRETEVFQLWATGHGSKAIEAKLVVSSATVKTHLRHIYEKCDVHSRAEILELIEHAK